MMLYKFMSRAGFEKFTENSSLLFNNPRNFNDPFDCEISHFIDDSGSTQHYFGSASHSMLLDKIGILCLTRNKLNLLMWAHYADNHAGVVVGIEVSESGLDAHEQTIIPSTRGSIVYTSIRPKSLGEYQLDPALLARENAERIFLHKSIHWAYEEEVRIVRLNKTSGPWQPILPPPHQLVSIPANCVKEIYFGARYDHIKESPPPSQIASRFPKAKLHKCDLDPSKWKLILSPLSTHLRQRRNLTSAINRALKNALSKEPNQSESASKT